VYETSGESPENSVVSFFRSRANRTAPRYRLPQSSAMHESEPINLLNRGEIVEHGTWQTLLSRPGSLFAGMAQAIASS